MDVTSLLNTSAAAAAAAKLERSDSMDRASTPSATSDSTAYSTAVPTPSPEHTPAWRSSSTSRSPIRSRTPWDAGGYSLPLSLDVKSIHSSSSARPAFYNDSNFDSLAPGSPKSPKHKFSDSRSSFSSYVSSSNNSVSHSRISSLSTVGELQPLTTLLAELPPLDTQKKPSHLKCPVLGDVQPPSPAPRQMTHMDSAVNPADIDRPRSPSDAVMIKRGSISSLR
jgi:hypothetical protein